MTSQPRRRLRALPSRQPYEPFEPTVDEVAAIKGLTAMQLSALRKFTGADQPTFWPDNERVSSFAQGKRFVWDQIAAAYSARLAPERTS